ncbi:MAG: hypothetical protein LBQ02_02550 [Candidatus Nomurabacteria bacterium]|jgi:hypothetical protein|nr:hypothetical protein [Candidatus Nomurabacteria bacterium]
MERFPTGTIEYDIRERLKNRYDEIVNRQLTVENIDHYADDALEDLIKLSDEIVEIRRSDGAMGFESLREEEDTAFAYYGLEDMEEALEHIIKIRENLMYIDDFTGQSQPEPSSSSNPNPNLNQNPNPNPPIANQVELGADENEQPAAPESCLKTTLRNLSLTSDHEQLTPESRTKTVLFVLKQDFGIDFDDPEQVSITPNTLVAPLTPDTSTKPPAFSYNMIEIPELQRIVLVCDIKSSSTFVLDEAALQEKNITQQELGKMLDKETLKNLISEYPELGSRLSYSKNYVTRIKKLLGGVPDEKAEELANSTDIDNAYLNKDKHNAGGRYYNRFNLPEGVLTVHMFAKNVGCFVNTLKRWLQKNSELVGEIETYSLDLKDVPCLTPEQQQCVLDNMELLSAPKAPEGVMSILQLAKNSGLSYYPIYDYLKNNRENIGELKKFRFHDTAGIGLTPEQQQYILDKLTVPEPPEGAVSVEQLAKKVGRSCYSITLWLSNSSVGELKRYRPKGEGGFPAPYLTPEQQQYVLDNITFAPEDGVVSISQFAVTHKIGHYTLHKWLAANPPEDELKSFQFRSRTALGLTPNQQQYVLDNIDSIRHLVPAPPDGVVSLVSFAKEIRTAHTTLTKWLADNSQDTGEIGIYRFGKIPGRGLTPEQQQIIKSRLHEIGRKASKPPAD